MTQTLTSRPAPDPMLHDPCDPTHAGNCHLYAKLYIAVGAAHGVLCGVELLRIQKELKKSTARCTFEAWLEENEAALRFNRTTAFVYKRIAEGVKSKLLAGRNEEVLALLTRHPASLTEEEQATLLKALDKALEGKSIRELLEDYRFARKDHQAPRNTLRNAGDGNPPPMHVPIEQQVREQVQMFLQFTEEIHRKVKLGREQVLLITQWPDDQIEQAIQLHEHNLAALREVKKARRK